MIYVGVRNVFGTLEIEYLVSYLTRYHAKQLRSKDGVKGASGLTLKR